MLKPALAVDAELMVRAAVPLEVSVSDCTAGVFRFTLPKERLALLSVNAGTAAFNCMPKLAVNVPAEAVTVAGCGELTADTPAANIALVAPAGIVTEAGTLTAGLLLVSVTANPLLPAAALIVTTQESVPAPAIDAVAQEIPLKPAS
jgi:hypothetical protein